MRMAMFEGKGPEDIAARFGVTPTLMRQRLKLACVSPKLIQIYRDGEMGLDQLMAFTLSDDHKAQEIAWFDPQPWNRQLHTIRKDAFLRLKGPWPGPDALGLQRHSAEASSLF